MKNLQKGFIVPILLASIALLVIGGGVYVYKQKKVEVAVGTTDQVQNTNTQSEPVVNNQNTSTKNQTIKPSINSTYDWKTHTDSLGNYSIKYPPNWYLSTWQSDSGSGSSIYISNFDSSVRNILDNPEDMYVSISSFTPTKGVNYSYLDIPGNMLVDGVKAFNERTYEHGGDVGYVTLGFNNKIYHIKYPGKQRSAFDKIISSFKFTK